MALNRHKGQVYHFDRSLLCRLVFTGIFCSLLYGFFSGVLVHQLVQPALRYPFIDPVFLVAHSFRVPELFTSSPFLAWSLDIVLFLSCLLAIVRPRSRVYPAIFLAAYLIYFIIFNSYGAHHTLSKAGVLLLPLPFLAKQKNFAALWTGLRYYLLFIFVDAFSWKLFRLSWLHPQQAELILKKNLAPYLYFHPHTMLGEFYRFLLIHPGLLQFLFISGFLLEGSFILGFFTRRYDTVLFVFMVLLITGFWLMADAFFVELLLLALTFLPAEKQPRPAAELVVAAISVPGDTGRLAQLLYIALQKRVVSRNPAISAPFHSYPKAR